MSLLKWDGLCMGASHKGKSRAGTSTSVPDGELIRYGEMSCLLFLPARTDQVYGEAGCRC